MKRLEELGISPAPWHIKDGTDVPCMKCELYEMPLVDSYGSFKNENDVRLIAATPELYEALRLCVAEMCRDCKASAICVDGCKSVNMARTALEKAGGKE